MPLKLNIGLSRKVGQPNFGSRQASIGLEVELDASILTEPELLQERVGMLYSFAERAIETELSQPNERLRCPQPGREAILSSPCLSLSSVGQTQANSTLLVPEEITPLRKPIDLTWQVESRQLSQERPRLTSKQHRAIHAICRRLGLDPFGLIRERFQLERVDELDIRQASRLIDELKDSLAMSPTY
jgi:hypothetical protein